MDDPVTEKHRQLAEKFLQDLLLQSKTADETNLLVITPQLFPEVADGVTCNGYGDCVSLLREPDAANPHVRFDGRDVETEAWRG
jgi:hypothetical protein